jgi:hypothetical protein
VSVVSGTKITCNFDITGAAGGTWDVAVTNPDTKSGVLAGCFTVVSAPPVLVSPSNNAANVSITPALVWHKTANDSLYTLQLSASSSFSLRIINDNQVTDTSVTIPPALLANNYTYYWKVATTKKGGEITAFSAQWSFTTLPLVPGAVSLLSPADNAVNTPVFQTMRWNLLSGALSYRMQIATDSLFGAIIRNDSLLADTTDGSGTLLNNTRYFWHVRAINPGGTGPWSATGRFTTIVALPGQVMLAVPAKGDTIKTDSVYLSWMKISSNLDHYRIEYATYSSFTSPIIDSSVTDTFKLVKGLHTGTMVWWHVQAHNAAGWGSWSARNSFEIKLPLTSVRSQRIPKEYSFTISRQNGIISYSLPKPEDVTLQIYNLSGKLQSELVNTRQEAGYYSIRQRGLTATGIYLLVFKAGSFTVRKRMNVVR